MADSLASKPTVETTALCLAGHRRCLEAAGFDHVALVEFDKNAAATVRLNQPDWPIVISLHLGCTAIAPGTYLLWDRPITHASGREAP